MKFYTVKEIADILNVSKTTIQKAIKAANIEYDKIEKNRQYYCIDKTKQIIIKINKNFNYDALQEDFKTENSPTETENQIENSPTETENQIENSKTKTENQIENSKTKSENSPTETENSKTIDKALEILENQLEEKDNTIKDLQEKLAAAYSQISEQSRTIADLATKAQYITAADKTAQIMDKQQKEKENKTSAANDIIQYDESNKYKKKKWFEFWKNK